jgi:preprotein translocase subunit SecE
MHRVRAWGPPVKDLSMATRTNPIQFVQQVRAEVAKVVWPTRREVLLTSIMVLIMSALAAAFFFVVDLAIRSGLQALLGLIG